MVILVFGCLWAVLFFASLPQQRRLARSLDARRPGLVLANGVLEVPTKGGTLLFRLGEPCALAFGWFEFTTPSPGGPTTNTRGFLTHARLSQAGQHLQFFAEDSAREAQAALWPKVPTPEETSPRVRLWASDLVALVEALRASGPSAPS